MAWVDATEGNSLTAVPDTNGVQDVYVRDLQARSTTLVSVNRAGSAIRDLCADACDARRAISRSACVPASAAARWIQAPDAA